MKRMMDQAYTQGHIPLEQLTHSGTQAAHVVVCTVFIYDMIRALHITAELESVDLGNCYNAVVHILTSITIQVFMVPLTMVIMVLLVL